MLTADRPPNWAKWRLIPFLRICEAVALSLNIDPDRICYVGDPFGDGPSFEEGRLFIDRLDIVRANAWGIEGKEPNPVDASPLAKINLRRFINWALSVKWDVPPELAAIADKQIDAPSIVAGERSTTARGRGGRPAEYDWDEMEGEFLRYIALNDFPETQAELVEHLLEWFDSRYGKQPAESMVKDKVSRWYRLYNSAAENAAKRPKTPTA